EPWYPDQTRGIPKTSESRAIESVMNALVIVRRDASTGHLTDDAGTALGVMWKLQMRTGPNSGAWTWLNFNYEPWESPNSTYFGASLAALLSARRPTAMPMRRKFRRTSKRCAVTLIENTARS